jgi:hypothetical protein
MHRVVKVAALPHYHLHVEFDDGVAGIVEMFSRLIGPVFEPLRDEAVFRTVTIDQDTGAVCWPGGPDLAPDAMYSRLSGKPLFSSGGEGSTEPPPAAQVQPATQN